MGTNIMRDMYKEFVVVKDNNGETSFYSVFYYKLKFEKLVNMCRALIRFKLNHTRLEIVKSPNANKTFYCSLKIHAECYPQKHTPKVYTFKKTKWLYLQKKNNALQT